MPRKSAALAAGLSLMSLFSLSGCATVSYLWQAGQGQFELFNRAQPLEEVIARETTPPRVKRLLSEVPKVKAFGEASGLKPTKNYVEYVQLDRPYVVTVVAACEELEFKPKVWRFPVVGSFPYLGFFKEASARKYGEELKKQGWDVEVRGAGAYSTLGWFRDAILSSMISQGDEALGELVDVVLHESVHATHYVENQSYFNESLASFIAEGLTTVYLREHLGAESVEEKAYLADLRNGERIRQGLHQTYSELDAVYRSSATPEEKRRRKAEIFSATRTRLGLRRELNNAYLIQFKTYQSGAEAFRGVHERCGRDWGRTLRTLFSVKAKDFPQPQFEDLQKVLTALACRD